MKDLGLRFLEMEGREAGIHALGLEQYNNHYRSSVSAFVAYENTVAHYCDTAMKLHNHASLTFFSILCRGCGVRMGAKMDASDSNTAAAWRGGFASQVVRRGAKCGAGAGVRASIDPCPCPRLRVRVSLESQPRLAESLVHVNTAYCWVAEEARKRKEWPSEYQQNDSPARVYSCFLVACAVGHYYTQTVLYSCCVFPKPSIH